MTQFIEAQYRYIKECASNPEILRLLDVFDEGEKLYVVMEYMDGGPIFNVIAHDYSISEWDICCITRQLVKTVGLAAFERICASKYLSRIYIM